MASYRSDFPRTWGTDCYNDPVNVKVMSAEWSWKLAGVFPVHHFPQLSFREKSLPKLENKKYCCWKIWSGKIEFVAQFEINGYLNLNNMKILEKDTKTNSSYLEAALNRYLFRRLL